MLRIPDELKYKPGDEDGDKFSSALVPRAGTIERGLYDMWCFFLISELDASLVIWGRHHYYEVKNGAAPAALAAAKEYLRKQMKVVVDELAQKEYLMGSAFTAVDILIARNHVHKRGFTRAITPHEGNFGTAVNMEGQVFEKGLAPQNDIGFFDA